MHPIAKASLTSGSVFILGDVINQLFIKKSHRLDWAQTAQFGCIGFTLHGPYFRKGLQYLDKWFGNATTIKSVMLKSIAGQFVIFPPYVGLYLGYSSILNNKDPIISIKEQFPRIMTNGLFVWPIANVINFRFIPVDYRLLYINAVGVGWNSYLSWETFRDSDSTVAK